MLESLGQLYSEQYAARRKPGQEKNWRLNDASGGQEAEKELECSALRSACEPHDTSRATKERSDVALRQIERIASVSEQVSLD